MKIAGLQKLTLLDYPEHVAATIFLYGCNIRCKFCQNIDLINGKELDAYYTLDEILDFLKTRIGKLEGVCITGGEPLINHDLYDLIYPIKDMGLKIKLDTNGFFPDALKDILDKNLVDMVAMDIKSGITNYENITHSKDRAFLKSINMLLNSDIKYEFRTTCVKGLHTEKDFYEIRDMIKGAKAYYLQDYRANELIEDLPYSAFTYEELSTFKDIVKENIPNTFIRGV